MHELIDHVPGAPVYVTDELVRENLDRLLAGEEVPDWALNLFERTLDGLEKAVK
jgi:hypothetical protein